VTILAVPGAVGSVVSVGGPAIHASNSSVRLALRNLRIVPLLGGGGSNGVDVFGIASLALEDTVVSGHPGFGVGANGATAVRITRCILRDNGGEGVNLAGGATAMIVRSRVMNNAGSGVLLLGTSTVSTSASVSDSVLAGNFNGLAISVAVAGNKAGASITRSSISDNAPGAGVSVSGPGSGNPTATIGNSMVTGNATGVVGTTNGVVELMGNNVFRQNGVATGGGNVSVATF
jgi:hypothetical protein